jgi:FkbH-like protein
MLADQPFFDTAVVTEDDVNRGGEYKAQAQRAELESTVGSRDEFLASMGIVCTFQSALQAPLSRAVQLLAKTNQFNLTTRRRSAAEVEEFAAAPGGQAVVVRVRDRFGDAGVVGLALARSRGDACCIDSFLLSCRVIGRGIESALVAFLAEQAQRNGATRLVGEFLPTKKNSPCATFYSDHGFTQTTIADAPEPDSVFYELDLTTAAPTCPKWITLEGNESHELSASTVFSA